MIKMGIWLLIFIPMILFIAYFVRRTYQIHGEVDGIISLITFIFSFMVLLGVGIALLPFTIIYVIYDVFTSIKEKLKS